MVKIVPCLAPNRRIGDGRTGKNVFLVLALRTLFRTVLPQETPIWAMDASEFFPCVEWLGLLGAYKSE